MRKVQSCYFCTQIRACHRSGDRPCEMRSKATPTFSAEDSDGDLKVVRLYFASRASSLPGAASFADGSSAIRRCSCAVRHSMRSVVSNRSSDARIWISQFAYRVAAEPACYPRPSKHHLDASKHTAPCDKPSVIFSRRRDSFSPNGTALNGGDLAVKPKNGS